MEQLDRRRIEILTNGEEYQEIAAAAKRESLALGPFIRRLVLAYVRGKE